MTRTPPYRLSPLTLLLAGLSLSAATACQTTKQARVVEVSDDGQAATLQLSRDNKSLLAADVAAQANTARQQLKERKELSIQLMNSIAELSLLSGNPTQAALEARSLLKRDLKNTDAMKTLIKVSLSQNRPEEAILLAENAIAVQPRDADLQCLKGLAEFLAGDPLAARQAWKKALEINPTHISAHMNLATLYYHNRNVSLAGAAFEKALALQPQNPDALVGKALVMSAQGQAEPAKQLLVGLLQTNPKSPLVLYNLAVLEKEKFQNYTAAMDYTERYLNVAKGDRKSTEKFIAQREELKILMAKAQGPLSDQQLREMAATRSQSIAQPGQDEEAQQATQTARNAQPSPTETEKSPEDAPQQGTIDLNTNDAQALEDAIK